MTAQVFIIKSLLVQNTIMLISLGVVVVFLASAIVKKRPKQIVVAVVWVGIVIWFFNSAYFGFSAVTVSPQGIRVNYGVLSLQNDLLPIHSPWEIETAFSDIRKLKKVYAIRIGDRRSMRVRGEDGHALLQEIGAAIDRWKGGS